MASYYHSNYGGKNKQKKSKLHRFIMFTLTIMVLAALGFGYLLYKVIYAPNVWVNDGEQVNVYIPTDASFDQVKSILYTHGVIIHRNNFEWFAKKKKYPQLIKGGKYTLTNGMSNLQLINKLRAGDQDPVDLIFNNIRDVHQLATVIGAQIEPDSTQIADLLTDSLYVSNFGLAKETAICLFIPNTYEVYWTITAEEFITRMYQEYKRFWNTDRIAKIEELGLSIPEAITLASIVEKEALMNDEKPIIAGLYINRLKRGWRLQADPTLVFAIGDFTIRRVLDVHKEIDSPYNTYKYGGLPPGPICSPSITSIKAVINYADHNYLYMCAKDDFSGYHVFARTNAQHSRNARKYQKALDQLKIYH